MATDLSEKYKQLAKETKKSPSYFSTSPTSSDTAIQTRMASIQKQIDSARDKELRKQWYGDEPDTASATVTQPREGLITRTLKGLQMPTYMMVGAAESLTGKGTEKNIFKNIIANVDEEEAFGSLYRKLGMNSALATGLGLASDIAFDPINWATVGTTAMIPRIAKGVKTSAEAGKLGFKTALMDKALTLAKPIKSFAPETKAAKKLVDLTKQNVLDYKAYNTLVGKSMDDLLTQKGAIGDLAGAARKSFGETETGKKVGDWYEKYLEYSPLKWYQKRKALEESSGGALDFRATLSSGDTAATRKMIENMEPVVERFRESGKLSNDFEKAWQGLKDADYNINRMVMKNAQDILDDGARLATDDKALARIFNADEKLKAMRDEYLDDVSVKMAAATAKASGLTEDTIRESMEALRKSNTYTGVDWYDTTMDKIRNATFAGDKVKAKSVLDGYSTFIDLFKTSKVAGNPATHVLSIVGNAVFAGMYGLRFWEPAYLKSVKAARKILAEGGEIKTIAQLFANPKMAEMIRKNPTLMRAVYGIDLNTLLSKESIGEAVQKFLASEDMLKASGATKASMKMADNYKDLAQRALKEALEGAYEKGMSPYKKMLEGAIEGTDSTFISREMGSINFRKMVDALGKSADGGNVGAKALHWYFTKPMEAFEKIDQSFKLGTAIHLMNNGITEKELQIMSRFYPLKFAEDVFQDGATGLYKLTPDAATGVVQDIYMNYAAMPAGIKVLRSLPFFGSPFASFSFAMLTKAAKTAVYNPSFYNKIQFTLDEINGGKSPLERAALKQPYYEWYNRSGMVSLPFFRDNPVYLNAASFLPYLTMNIFEPAERKYGTGLGSQVAKTLDAIPFFKTPEGQLTMDYLIMPHLLGEATNMWGGQLWPSDASAIEKFGYMTRGAAEMVVPPGAGILGVVTPEEVLDYAPLYRLRQIGYATEGKTPLGIKGKESKTSRTARAILSAYAGINLYPIDITYTKK